MSMQKSTHSQNRLILIFIVLFNTFSNLNFQEQEWI